MSGHSRKLPSNHSFPPPAGPLCLRAFTLVELLIVVAIIAILAAMLFPVLSAAKAKSRETACLNNLKQMAAGSSIYADDNGSKFMDNLPLAVTQPAGSNNWALGNMKMAAQSTNTSFLKSGELFPYTTQPALYRCPADISQTNGALRVRSYSMNSWIGSRYMITGERENGFRTFATETETAITGTSTLWLIADENELTIDDAWWLVTMDNSQPFVSYPATRHNRGYNLSFVDGHVERWSLYSTNTVSPSVRVNINNSDWNRLKLATTTKLGPQ
ncbi:MAG TPA: prepilin-type N-terminal cleavage/methylation domain-containing protein [Candidatus Acidoferrum sp.]|nr:prepilin-type N-terminal cleavage/methylation domain-containing protein [Candidatus Acidoferrum sp.]